MAIIRDFPEEPQDLARAESLGDACPGPFASTSSSAGRSVLSLPWAIVRLNGPRHAKSTEQQEISVHMEISAQCMFSTFYLLFFFLSLGSISLASPAAVA